MEKMVHLSTCRAEQTQSLEPAAHWTLTEHHLPFAGKENTPAVASVNTVGTHFVPIMGSRHSALFIGSSGVRQFSLQMLSFIFNSDV